MATFLDLAQFSFHCDRSTNVIVNGATGQILTTSLLGGKAFDMLQRGYPVEDVERILAKQMNTSVHLGPFIQKLTVIGAHAGPKPYRWRTVACARKKLKAFIARLRLYAFRASCRCLPLATVVRLHSRVVHKPKADPKFSRLVSVALNVPPDTGERIQRQAALTSARCMNHRFLLAGLPVSLAIDWIHRTRFEGRSLESLELPVVFVGFHTGSYSLLPFILAMNGVALNTLTDLPKVGIDAVHDVAERLAPGKLEFIPSRFGFRRLVKGLEIGRSSLILPDALHSLKKSTGIEVNVSGATLSLPRGAAALSRLSNRPLVPVFLETSPIGENSLTIGEIQIEGGEIRALEGLCSQFESWLAKRPEQWIRWSDYEFRNSPPQRV